MTTVAARLYHDGKVAQEIEAKIRAAVGAAAAARDAVAHSR